ncbi:MAG: methionine--tRNA ligase [Sedimentisphaerales bacterium]|nr:methionine--tRNA ligase [Sedimentisphaerales bacterium]
MPRNIAVTSALPYANGPIHMGHLVEYIQTDIFVRFQKLCGNRCLYFCADDTHGTAIMISAKTEGITPEQLIERVHNDHHKDLAAFHIEFDNFYSTHSPENKELSELIFSRLNEKGSIAKRTIAQTYCDNCKMFLPDRYIRGECPRCHAPDQYGDSCEACSGTHSPTELLNPKCAHCGNTPIRKQSEHYFFKLADYEKPLKKLIDAGHTHKSVANKLDEWFSTGLKDWDISRDGPYFGFKIPGEDDKYFYVWLDAPIGYMASAKNYCDKHNLNFEDVWNGDDWQIYHFIGKDIMYFHALFWPAMLMGSGFKTANNLFVHGFLTVNGEKMSKSRGTFIKAATYLNHLDPEFLRYYYASKLTAAVEDIDLSVDDFISKTNSDLVGKFANLASRSGPMLCKYLDSKLGTLDEQGRLLIDELIAAKQQILNDYEGLNYSSAIRTITALADSANRYVEQNQPWTTIKNDLDTTRTTLTAVINAVRILSIYLKPVLPAFAEKIEKFLNISPQCFADIDKVLENHTINKFARLFERIDKDKVQAMIDESKDTQAAPAPQQTNIEPLAPECTIEDFMKVDLRIAKVLDAKPVEGADKLLELKLDIGCCTKTVFAGIAKAYKPEDLVGKIVVCVANLKPRKMKFGLSEGMILAAGQGDADIFMLTTDSGPSPGQRVK